MVVRVCGHCQKKKPFSDFYYQHNGGLIHKICKDCQRKITNFYQKAWKRKRAKPKPLPTTSRICNICHIVKPIEEFSHNPVGNMRKNCKECYNKLANLRRKTKLAEYPKLKEQRLEYRKKWAKIDRIIKPKKYKFIAEKRRIKEGRKKGCSRKRISVFASQSLDACFSKENPHNLYEITQKQ